MRTLAESLGSAARLLGERTFIVFGGERITYAEFDRLAARLANVLSGQGVGPGDIIGLYLPSVPLLAAGYQACQKIGAVAAPISAMSRSHDLDGIVARTKMPVILANRETLPHALDARERMAADFVLLASGGASGKVLDADRLMAEAPDGFDPHPGRPEDAAALFFTSGTTGAPKGAVQTQCGLYTTVRDMAVHGRFLWGREVFMCALPLFNNFGATVLMDGAIFSGASMVLRERWDTGQVLDDITRERVTFIAGSPTMFLYLLRDFDPARHDLSSLTLAVTGGAPVSPNVVDQFSERFGVPLLQIYGATEVSGYVTAEPAVGPRRRGSAGLPIGGSRIDIVDDAGRPLPTGEVGEVRISGDVLGGGYWHDAKATEDAFTPDGWLSGDLGRVDEDGYLYIVDRKKDVVISGGYNIYPLEVEDLLYTHPDIRVCAVIGLPDDTKGEIPVAVVIPKNGSSIDAPGLIAFCRERLSAYKAPRRVFVVDDMPLGPSGKILKRTLRVWAVEGRLAEVA